MASDIRALVLRRLREKLPATPDAQLEEYADRASEYFCAKTKRRVVPLTAAYLWVDMAMRLHELDGSTATGKVTSIKRGDTSIQYSDGAVAEAMTDIEGRIAEFKVARLI